MRPTDGADPAGPWPAGGLADQPDPRLHRSPDGRPAGPGIAHGCSYKTHGGLLLRMREGTWLGHVIEHVALELQKLAGRVSPGQDAVGQGPARRLQHPLCLRRRRRWAAPRAGRHRAGPQPAAAIDLQGVEGLDRIAPPLGDLTPPLFDLRRTLEHLRTIARRETLGPTTRSLVTEARRRGIPVQRLDDQSLVQLGWGARRKLIRASITGQTSHIAVETAGNKALTKSLLAAWASRSPRRRCAHAEEASRQAARIKGPVVLKPLDGNHGRGVSLGLETPDQIAGATSRRSSTAAGSSSKNSMSVTTTASWWSAARSWPWPNASRLRWSAMAQHRGPTGRGIVNQDPRRGDRPRAGHDPHRRRRSCREMLAAGKSGAGSRSRGAAPSSSCGPRPTSRPAARRSIAPTSSIPTTPPSPGARP
jgi:hypothetical protein